MSGFSFLKLDEQQTDASRRSRPVEERPATAPAAPESGRSEWKARVVPVSIPAGVPVLPFDGLDPVAAEQYRIIRTRLLNHPSQARVVAVSSGALGDGKSFSAVNIAGALALKDDMRVLLVNGDLRNPSVARMLGIPESPGMGEALTGGCSLTDAIVRVEQLPNLYVLPGGKVQGNGAELLDSQRWREAIAFFRRQFNYTVIDAPPVGAVADYYLIESVADAVVVVVRPDHTLRRLCFSALETIPKEKLAGVVLNANPDWFLWKTQPSYYGRYDQFLRRGK